VKNLSAVLQKYANPTSFGVKTEPLVPQGGLTPPSSNFGVKQEPLVPQGGLTPPTPATPPPATPAPATPPSAPATPPPATPAPATPAPAQPPPAGTPAPASTGAQPQAAPAPAPVSVNTTESPNTPITPEPAQPAPAAAPVAPNADAILKQLPQDSKIPPEQRAEFAKGIQSWIGQNPDRIQGAQDFMAGKKDTPQAQAFAQQFQKSQNDFVSEQMAKLTAANPDAAATPQGWAGMLNQATDAWHQMPFEMQMLMGLGLGSGLVGMGSAIFGEGGVGMGLLGLLGIGAAGLGGAAGGMFGQDAQNMVADGIYNVGSFFGAVPNEKIDLSQMMGEDALARLTAGPSLAEKARAAWNPEGYAEQVRAKLQAAEQAKKLMMVPQALRPRFLQNASNTPLTDEEAQIVARNIEQLSAGMDDENSDIYKMMQEGNEFTANPTATRNQRIKGMFSSIFKNGSVMNIHGAIEKWAFNAMDAKELKDLKAEKAKGVPYRVESARREQQLSTRQQAAAAKKSPPVQTKKCVAVVMKAARCWSGYEPVPGAKAYSRGSCRPVNSKKTQKEMISGKKKEK
jgi:hypothetical protein